MKLIIVRHADPDYSIDSLTATGWKEARLLADRIAKLDVKNFYVSPLGRAQDTARVSLEPLGRTAETLPWLKEFGPTICKPGHDQPDCLWDWLPADWTTNPNFYDPQRWTEHPLFAQAGVAAEAAWVQENLDSLLARRLLRLQRSSACSASLARALAAAFSMPASRRADTTFDSTVAPGSRP